MRVTFPWHLVGIAFAAVSCLLIAISCFRNGKRGWGYVFVGFALILLLAFWFVLKSMNKVSGKAGGHGGFGGGSSGGGGSTGSW